MSKDRKPAREASPSVATATRKASRRLTQLYDNALKPCGLKSTQYAILAEPDRRSQRPPTIRELADALVMDRSALGHNLRPLERNELIALDESEEDRRRRRHVVMTPQGKAKFKQEK
jgi:DNA-binding MarR family transcriptional regulator